MNDVYYAKYQRYPLLYLYGIIVDLVLPAYFVVFSLFKRKYCLFFPGTLRA